jgi:hypothetical protein
VFSQNLAKELYRMRQEVAVSIRDGNPTIENRSAMIMATTWLGVIEIRIRKTRNLEERRELIQEFHKGKQVIEKIIRMLGKDKSKTGQERGEVLQQTTPGVNGPPSQRA